MTTYEVEFPGCTRRVNAPSRAALDAHLRLAAHRLLSEPKEAPLSETCDLALDERGESRVVFVGPEYKHYNGPRIGDGGTLVLADCVSPELALVQLDGCPLQAWISWSRLRRA